MTSKVLFFYNYHMTFNQRLTIYLCLFLGLNSTLCANELLECLGKEETLLHQKKVQGPIYQLNQNLIGLFSTHSELKVESNILRESCENSNSKLGTSVILLKNMALGRGKIFVGNASTAGSLGKKDIVQAIPGLLFDYFSGLQSLAKDPHCLDQEMPKLLAIKTKIKYLESESNSDVLLSQETANIKSIFTQIENLDKIYEKCSKRPKPTSKSGAN